MFEFFTLLFNTDDFPRRWNCGIWTEGHGYLHVMSDIATGTAYMAIPVVLGLYAARRPDTAFPKLVWLFVTFILACGMVHLIEATIFWWPIYRVSGLMKFVTAVASWGTVIALVKVAPIALDLPGLKAVNKQLTEEIEAHRGAESRLEQVIQTIRDGIVVADSAGRLEIMNDSASRLLNTKLADVRRRDWTPPFQLLYPDTDIEFAPRELPLARAIAGNTIDSLEVMARPAQGEDRLFECDAMPITDVDGNSAGGIVTFHDVTQVRKMERERSHYYRRLEKLTEFAAGASQNFDGEGAIGHRILLSKFMQLTESEFCQLSLLTGHGDVETSVEAMRHGAFDFLQKPYDTQRMKEAIRTSLPKAAELWERWQRHQEVQAKFDLLSTREREVCELLLQGTETRRIAATLDISPSTVEKHRLKIFEKMAVNSVPLLIREIEKLIPQRQQTTL